MSFTTNFSKRLMNVRPFFVAFFFLGVASLGAADDRPVYVEPPLLLGEGIAPQSSAVETQLFSMPGRSGASPTVAEERESGRFIVSKRERDTWSVNERFSHVGIGDALAIPGTAEIPRDLWSLDAGAAYHHRFDAGRDGGISFNTGSESDKPFHSLHETVFRVTANYRVPSGASNAWLFFLNYSNNRHFLNGVPLPGFAYFFQSADRRWQGLVGFPFAALRFKPDPDWTLQASIFGPRNLSAEIARRWIGPLRLFTAFQWNSQEWMIAGRANNDDRLFFNRKRASVGLRAPVGGFVVELSGGRKFDQRFFIHDSSSYRDVPSLGLRPAWVMETKISYRFGRP